MSRLVVLLLLLPVCAIAQTKLVIYSENFASITEPLLIKSSQTETILLLTNLPSTIEPDTITISCTTNPQAVKVLEQEFVSEPLNEIKLLQLHEGRYLDFELVNPTTNERRTIRGRLLRAPVGDPTDPICEAIVEVEGKLRFGLPGKPLFDIAALTGPLKPLGIVKVRTDQVGRYLCELSYLANGIGWKTVYNLVQESDSTCSLVAYANIYNSTGRDFYQSSVTLIAGEPRKVGQPTTRIITPLPRMSASLDEAQPQPEAEFEYYRFRLPTLLNLPVGQTKLYELFRAPEVKITTSYIFRPPLHPLRNPEQPINATVALETTNSPGFGLGQTLPAGQIRVFSRLAESGVIFLGESAMPNTPLDQQIKLEVGKAFDVTLSRKIVSQTPTPSTPLPRTPQTIGPQIDKTIELTISNAKTNAVKVQVMEPMEYPVWRILNSSHPFSRVDAQTALFEPTVPAKSSIKITYTVRYNEKSQ